MGSTMIMVLSAVILISLTWKQMESEASEITRAQARDDNEIITDERRNIIGRFSLKPKRGKGKGGSSKSGSSGKKGKCRGGSGSSDSDSSSSRSDDDCCETDDHCIDRLRRCVNNTCQCIPAYVDINGTCTPLSCTGEPCNAKDQCKGENVKCDNELNICLCEEGFLLTEKGKCVNCSTVDFRNYTIPCPGAKLCKECEDGFVLVDDECVSLLCGKCTMDSDCFGDKQVCENYECVCRNNTYPDHCGVCQSKLENDNVCECGDQCESSTCLCGVCVPPDTSDCCNGCDQIKADVIFITDNSGSVTQPNYRLQMYFLITLLNAFQISPTESFAAWIDYASIIYVAYDFNNPVFNDNLKVTKRLCEQPFKSGGTNTALALQTAINILNGATNRPGIPNIVVVMTDGVSSTSVFSTAAQLKSMAETKVVAVGIGGGVNINELNTIASSPDLVFLTDFSSLNGVTNTLLETICSYV